MKLSRLLIPAVLALLFSATGCLFHTRTVEVRLSSAKLQTATQQELIDRLNHDAAQIKTLNATVDIDTSVGGEKRGKVTDFKEIRGYVLVRKPNMLRMIGLYPIVRNKAFDMVSDGQRVQVVDSGDQQVLYRAQPGDQGLLQSLGHTPPPGHLRCAVAAGGRSPERNRRAGEQYRDGG